MGKGDGWGSTNTDAEAMLGLAGYMKADSAAPDQPVPVMYCPAAGCLQPASLGLAKLSGKDKLQRFSTTDTGRVFVTAASATADHPIVVQSELTYLPVEDGSHVKPESNGFVVSRTIDRIDPTGAPSKKLRLDQPGTEIALDAGEVIEDSAEIVNPEQRYHVAVVIPLAAGMEPLNPDLATAPPEATPSAPPTLKPTFVAFLDDQIAYFYDELPKGTYDFHFREKANVPGKFIQPAAYTEMMYNESVNGNGAGAMVTIAPGKGN
jgi:uncharacterized protein YfaS (alpha-2-macroglobulin family)